MTTTLIAATPLAFTGLAAAVAFRMRLFNIGGEGQLYFGAIGAAGIALVLSGQSTPVLVIAMIVGGAALGAAWGAIPGLLRAFLHTNEIITSLMLNYVAGLVLNYLIFDSLSYWRDTSADRAGVPAGQVAPGRRALAGALGRLGRHPVRLPGGLRRCGRDLGALHAHAVRLRGPGDRRFTARRALRRDADAAQDRRDHVPLRRDRRDRRRKSDGRLPARARCEGPAAGELRLHGDRGCRARALQPVRRRPRRIPPRRPSERRLRAAGRRFPVRPGRSHAGDDPVRDARRRAPRPLPDHGSPEGRSARRRWRRELELRRRDPRLRGCLRDAAALRRAGRAARGALGRAQPRGRGDDAGGRGNGLPQRAARRGLAERVALPCDPGRGARGCCGRGLARVPRDHAARESDRLGSRVDDLRRCRRPLVLHRQRLLARRQSGPILVRPGQPLRPRRSPGGRAGRLRAEHPGVPLVGLRGRGGAVPLAHAAGARAACGW